MRVPAWLPRAAAAHPERPALETAAGRLTYAELLARARAGAAALGAPRGPVALALPAGEAFAVALHACLLAGVPALPVDGRLAAAERAARTRLAARTIDTPLAPSGGAPATGEELHELEDPALALFTSGTTAAPKAVRLTYGNLLWSALGSALALGLDPAERWLCPLPLAHVGGLQVLVRSTIYATTAVVPERFDADATVRAIMREPITLVSLVPTQLARLLDAGLARPPRLRWALVGGGPIPPALLDRAQAAGVPVARTYGLTEAASQVAIDGIPLAGTRVRVAADGELLVAGPTVAPDSLAADGWLHTGDLATLDERGRVTIVGRRSDTIVTGGENVAPVEVEGVLTAHPAVADAAVLGRPDPEWGEALIALLVPRDRDLPPERELRDFCAARLARFKVPKRFERVPRLPRNAAGKLVRRELR